MNKKRIAIIGANEFINMLILKAKEKGYETHVFAWKSGDIGESTADYFYPISIVDKEKILNICRTIKPDGIASITSDLAVNTVNYVARQLGLNGNSEKTDEVARNKYQMRNAFRDAGLYTPWFIEVGEGFGEEQADSFDYPLIVKPTDRWSSKGVTRVNAPDKFSEAIKYAVSESFNKKAIVEGFMVGLEYSCECISYKGQHHILAFTKKFTTGYPHYIETGHIEPSDLSEVQVKKIIPVIYDALDALDIKNSAGHVEFRVLENGEIGIIEIGARMGGDCIGTDLVSISTGIDYIGAVVDVACGIEPDLKPKTKPNTALVKFITSKQDMEIYKTIRAEYSEYIIRVSIEEEVGSRYVLDSSTRFGYYVMSIEDGDEVKQRLLQLCFANHI